MEHNTTVGVVYAGTDGAKKTQTTKSGGGNERHEWFEGSAIIVRVVESQSRNVCKMN